jgi:hypothetical protein
MVSKPGRTRQTELAWEKHFGWNATKAESAWESGHSSMCKIKMDLTVRVWVQDKFFVNIVMKLLVLLNVRLFLIH